MDVRATGMRILVVEDDPATSAFLAKALTRLGHEVTQAHDVVAALELLGRQPWDAMLADIGLPGASGFDLVRETKRRWPRLPIALMTADTNTDVLVRALRSEVDDFLAKPISPDDLATQVARLLSRPKPNLVTAERVLAIGAHPDDVEIGIGGTLLGHRHAGDSVTIMTMSRGDRGGDRVLRVAESTAAARMVGAELVMEDLEDTQISQGDPTVGLIERQIERLEPTIIYTHTTHDLHQDHRSVHQATLVAARRVASVYCYESPSATVEFKPARFVPIGRHLDAKLEIIEQYASQVSIRSYLEPDLIRSTSRYWGRFGAASHCEPLEVVRERPHGAEILDSETRPSDASASSTRDAFSAV